MNLKVYSNSKVYLIAPARIATGGPELLHQLCYHLRNSLKIDAYMHYFPSNHLNPVHPNYKNYNNPFVDKIKDSSENILISPEIYSSVLLLKKYRKIRKVIWWLSVDNALFSDIYADSKCKFPIITLMSMFNKIAKKIFKIHSFFDIDKVIVNKYLTNKHFVLKFFSDIDIQSINLNLCQSHYAMNFLKNFSINNITYLSDYLNQEFFVETSYIDKKKDIVVYNPKKGFSFTEKIIKHAPKIKFVPLINMTRQQVIETLQKTKVYIDFGNHPGKDRLPREAAILGCCVITGKRGSAKYFEDVSIPEEYKFEDTKENINKIIQKIRFCFKNYKKAVEDFDYYKNVIKREKEKFLQDIKKIFKIKNE